VTCSILDSIPYNVFGRRLVNHAFQNRVPLGGSLELTFRCNLRCAHCYVAYGHSGLKGKQELARPEIDALFGQMADHGTLWLLLTGGDPLLRRDFPGVYADARRRGLLVTVFTNATLMTERIAAALAERPPYTVEVTLYGATQETYERVTGIPGSYARCMRGIEMLLRHNIPLKLKTMAISLNRHELGAMQALAARLGAPFRFDAMLIGGLGENPAPLALRLPPEEVARLESGDEQHLSGWRSERERVSGASLDWQSLYHCGAGLVSFHINPYGEMSMCLLARGPGYDLRAGDFHTGWTQALLEERRRQRAPHSAGECQECALQAVCGQCPGWSSLEHGEAGRRVDYLCRVTKARARRMDAPARDKAPEPLDSAAPGAG
jgi:radical SAM protein with 4Fe4S-binding SPASM domain